MRDFLCNIANLLLRPLKINAVKAKDFAELQTSRNNLIALYKARCRWDKNDLTQVVSVIFSKDRALQLHAFIESFYAQTKPQAPTHILYHASSPDHLSAYADLEQLYRTLPVTFHRQHGDDTFQGDLITLITSLHEDKILFFVDDIVVTESIDLNDLLPFDTDRFVPSLRMGLNIRKNYTVKVEQPLPDFKPGKTNDTDKIVWSWCDGVLDWGYPLSVDGHLFARQEILAMLQLLHFSAPNSLEDTLQQFNPLFSERLGVAYKKSKIMNIPCNKVQDENRNLSGDIHQDFLLQKWQEGFAMDLQQIYGYNNESPHQEIDIRFSKRNSAP